MPCNNRHMEYSMSSAAAAAESDLQLFAGAPSLTEEAYREAASQLERRLMTSIPGIPMDPALAADLYAGSIQGLPEPGSAISWQIGRASCRERV